MGPAVFNTVVGAQAPRRVRFPSASADASSRYPAWVTERLHEIAERLDTTVEELLTFLDSPAGRRLRRMLATGLILSVPLVMRIPGLKSSPIGRAIEFAGGAAIVMKLAEMIRDWEREQADGRHTRAIDVPPAAPSN